MIVIDRKATGRKIRNLMLEHNMTVEQVSVYMNIGQQAIYKWRRGACFPSIESFVEFADLMGVTIDECIIKKEYKDGEE